ncbi:MAG: hypothetical protein FWH47_03100, partial [Methanomassiliicoccaceae archaeon]|nr:hypothetical protein [Methanomassiliicoccaceae archaeon]
DDAQMERVARGLAAGAAGSAAPAVAATCRACPREARGKVTTEGNIITSCALAGAVQGCSSVTDAIVVIHGPRSCAHIMSSLRNISEIIRGASKAGNLQSMRMVSTDIDDTVSVFGGAGLLEEKVREAVMGGHRNIFVVTSCVPGIIGDNTIDVVNAISLEHPDVYLRVVEADGNITGDWNEGFVQSADALLDMVDGSVGPEADAANILAERYFYKRGEDKESAVVELFRHYGIRVNCRFMYESDMDSVRNFRKGRVSYLIDNDRSSLEVADLVEGRLGVRVDRDPLPVGMEEHRRFSERIGEEFGIAERAGRAFAELEGRYKAAIEGIRPRLEGKRALIENRFLQDIDWLLDLLADLGVEVVAIEVGPLHPWKDRGPPPRRLSERTRIRYDYTLADMTSDVEELSPDIVLSDAVLTDVGNAYHTTFSRPGPGLDGIIGFARRLGDIVRAPMREGWRDAA